MEYAASLALSAHPAVSPGRREDQATGGFLLQSKPCQHLPFLRSDLATLLAHTTMQDSVGLDLKLTSYLFYLLVIVSSNWAEGSRKALVSQDFVRQQQQHVRRERIPYPVLD
jgi:hypothetical protein